MMKEVAVPLSPRELRTAFGSFATGVTVVTAVRPDGEPVGITANSFTSVSLDPPMLLWCLNSASESLPAFETGASFAVHVLDHRQRDLAIHFARRQKDKFEVSSEWRTARTPPVLADVLCRFDCRVHAAHPCGDHVVIIGAITGVAQQPGRSLAFHEGRFGSVKPDPTSLHLDPWMSGDDHWY